MSELYPIMQISNGEMKCGGGQGWGYAPILLPQMPAFPLQGNETKILDTANFW